MRNLKYMIIAAASLALACSCRKELEDNAQMFTINATLPSSQTKVSLEQGEDSYDLLSKWEGFEYIYVFLKESRKYNEEAPLVKIDKVSEGGAGAFFSFKKPDTWGEHDTYQVKCFTSNSHPVVKDDKIYFNASLIRDRLEDFVAPVYCEGVAGSGGVLSAMFSHYYAYELLHVRNSSDKTITFSLSGFEAQQLWFKSKGSLCLDTGAFVEDMSNALEPEHESDAVTVEPGKEAVIISAYIPNGIKINNATMLAKVDGRTVKSFNTKSSNVAINRGHAYHLYVSWDGADLRFEEAVKSLEVTPEQLVFGSVQTGTSKTVGFTIENLTDQQLSIAEIYTPDPNFSFDWLAGTVAPHSSKQVNMTFTPDRAYQASGTLRVGTTSTYYDIPYTAEGVVLDTRGHDFVDMGFPSGVLWATCNLGADRPEEYGGYYAWGETRPMTNANIFDYTYTGDDVVLPMSADAAHVQWGGKWRLPSEAELRELYEYSYSSKCNVNGVDGLRFTSSINGESIFLPFAGMLYPSIDGLGTEGYYRSSFRFSDDSSWYLAIGMTSYSWSVAIWAHNGGRSGLSIRPVFATSDDVPSMYVKNNAANFGSVKIGTTETRFITIKNTGRAPLDISSFKMSKGKAFTVGVSGCTINPGMIETIPIYFKPSSESVVKDTLRLITNSLNMPEYELAVTGSGNNRKYTAGEAVDLGLSVKWSSVNLGATSPEKLGSLFAWGEFTERTDREVAYKWFSGYSTEYGGIIKYNLFKQNGAVDNKAVLDPEDDAATANLGSKWRMPTKAELNELLNSCTWTLTESKGVSGYEVTGPNGNSIFLPFDGYGSYWSSSLSEYYMEQSFYLSISGTSKEISYNYRSNPFSIRPVEN